MDFMLLAKVGMIIDGIVKGGYAIAGVYLVKTGWRYYTDYKQYLEQERTEVK